MAEAGKLKATSFGVRRLGHMQPTGLAAALTERNAITGARLVYLTCGKAIRSVRVHVNAVFKWHGHSDVPRLIEESPRLK